MASTVPISSEHAFAEASNRVSKNSLAGKAQDSRVGGESEVVANHLDRATLSDKGKSRTGKPDLITDLVKERVNALQLPDISIPHRAELIQRRKAAISKMLGSFIVLPLHEVNESHPAGFISRTSLPALIFDREAQAEALLGNAQDLEADKNDLRSIGTGQPLQHNAELTETQKIICATEKIDKACTNILSRSLYVKDWKTLLDWTDKELTEKLSLIEKNAQTLLDQHERSRSHMMRAGRIGEFVKTKSQLSNALFAVKSIRQDKFRLVNSRRELLLRNSARSQITRDNHKTHFDLAISELYNTYQKLRTKPLVSLEGIRQVADQASALEARFGLEPGSEEMLGVVNVKMTLHPIVGQYHAMEISGDGIQHKNATQNLKQLSIDHNNMTLRWDNAWNAFYHNRSNSAYKELLETAVPLEAEVLSHQGLFDENKSHIGLVALVLDPNSALTHTLKELIVADSNQEIQEFEQMLKTLFEPEKAPLDLEPQTVGKKKKKKRKASGVSAVPNEGEQYYSGLTSERLQQLLILDQPISVASTSDMFKVAGKKHKGKAVQSFHGFRVEDSNLDYSRHAEIMMDKRGITAEQILQVINKPLYTGQVKPAYLSRNNGIRYGSCAIVNGRPLLVFHTIVKPSEKTTIITSYPDDSGRASRLLNIS